MRITIIPVDGTVITDVESYSRLDLSSCNIPANVHALQFQDNSGWLEFTDGTPNQEITSLPSWVDGCLLSWQQRDDEFKKPATPTPADFIEKCKRDAKEKLSVTDWAVLPDVGIQNTAEFIAYRSVLRNYVLNPVESPVFPTEPNPVWI